MWSAGDATWSVSTGLGACIAGAVYEAAQSATRLRRRRSWTRSGGTLVCRAKSPDLQELVSLEVHRDSIMLSRLSVALKAHNAQRLVRWR